MRLAGKECTSAYFVGIGGIGMSALAQLLADHGVAVTGSDREESPVTELLTAKGITVLIGQKEENVPNHTDVVVYSEAVWEDNPERVKARELGIPQVSYFSALGDVSSGKKTIAISGTHGKTTTTGMTAALLKALGEDPTAVVGSLVKDFGSNYLSGTSNLFVVEACEYKRDFLTLSPSILVITNIEWDHTDYYQDLADVQSAFRALAEKVPSDGAIITNPNNPTIAPVLVGLTSRIIDYTAEQETYDLRLPGEFNQENARAAVAVARCICPEAEKEELHSALASFQGTWRRFEKKGKTVRGALVYDDYAHHPTAIQKTIQALRSTCEGKLYVAFHPHLYSRTRDLLDEFATAFSGADRVFIAPIYPAREVDDGSISSKILAERIQATGTSAEACTFEEIQQVLTAEPMAGDVVVTMGAGDIYKVADALVG